jgi:transcription elongation factor
MSDNRDNYWEDEDEDDTPTMGGFESDTDLVKKLRKALKAEQRRNKELETSYGELTKSQKERILKDVLASKGVNQKIAQFIPSDIEASEDAISAWLDSNGDVFGYTPSEKPAVNQDDINSLRKMDSVLTGAETPAASDDLANRIAGAESEEEILSILSGQ